MFVIERFPNKATYSDGYYSDKSGATISRKLKNAKVFSCEIAAKNYLENRVYGQVGVGYKKDYNFKVSKISI